MKVEMEVISIVIMMLIVFGLFVIIGAYNAVLTSERIATKHNNIKVCDHFYKNDIRALEQCYLTQPWRKR